MKVLLINPSLLQSEIGHYAKGIEKQRGVYPPLGLGYVASSLKRSGHQVVIVDCDAETNSWQKLKTIVAELDPDLVGFYTMTWTFRQAMEILKSIKELKPDIKSVIGGPNVSSFPKFSLEISDFDFAVVGEGEVTAVELVEALENNGEFDEIKGLIYKEKGKIIKNPPRQFNEDIDSISFPAWEELPIRSYYDIFTQKRNFITMMASRGCPFNCTFCDRKNRLGQKWRVRSPGNVVEEMEWLNSHYEIKEFMFFDDNFILDKGWIYQFCEELLRKDLQVVWECRVRVDMVDRPLLRAMKRAGCYRIRYGMESGDDEILKILKKGTTVYQIRECVKVSKEANIEIFAYFMMGSPFETPETLEKTLNLALEIDPDFAVFSKTILIVGSELFDWAINHGYIIQDHWEKFLRGEENNPAPVLETKQLPEKVIDKYIKGANKKFYLRPSYILKKTLAIRSFHQLWRQAKMAKDFLFK